MGRWKMGPQGGYWDANDSGPDQMTPTPEMQAQVTGAVPAGQGPSVPGDIGPVGVPGSGKPPGTNCWGPGCFGSPFSLGPGDGGRWGVNGGEHADLPSILAALRGEWGIQKPGGETMPGAATPLSQGQPGGMAQPRGMGGTIASTMKGSTNLGALGGLFGR